MKTLVQITAQLFENYGDSYSPNWKAKNTHKFNLYANSDLFMYEEEQCIEAIELMLFEQSNEKERFMYISHELIVSEPTSLHESIFLSKLQSVYTDLAIQE